MVGLVGPNGAGKTTLLLTLMGFLQADCGDAEINKQRVELGWRPSGVGFIPDRPVFYDWQTPVAHLATSAAFAGRKAKGAEIESALSAVGLQNEKQKPIRDFSRGMTQRLAWAQMMVTKPKLLLLDEPTSALDPLGVVALRDFVSEARNSGTGILFSSHTLSEVERICNRVLFLVRGTLSEMDHTLPHKRTQVRVRLHPSSSRDLGCLQAVATDVSSSGDAVSFALDGEHSLNDVVRILSDCGLEAISVEDQSHSLEVAFRNKLEGQ
ncbi:MAG: ABC transporter ATP-binding protein [Acidobacteriales bacterium]|nr:ABC transporter ATP-binding protein [Terriglobales bacterium]